ncbi:MAG: hypothetical protein H6597_03810 [Flavobacteriales bacterium]|nr:hypothetical protein [Flavobacteriales bacterium]MCB9193635.1 hypothetical protein [Flavobacteriales bacterium]
MITKEQTERLKDLYRSASRHSQYQIMPGFLAELVDPGQLNKLWDRFERERMEYFTRKVDMRGKRVVDIGANTGYFAFEALEAGAREVICYEGDADHVEFMRIAAEMFNKPLVVHQEFMDFKNPLEEAPVDVVLLLNVLHHVGFDFGEKDIDIEEAKGRIVKNLNWFADQTRYMIFQIGFSWMTQYDKPLFPNGTKSEMIAWLLPLLIDHWEVIEIGIAEVREGATRYEPLGERNIERNDAIGEFRNRPIFVLKSKLI